MTWLIFFFRFECACKYRKRRIGEEHRDWIKDISCMHHWMLCKYYAGGRFYRK